MWRSARLNILGGGCVAALVLSLSASSSRGDGDSSEPTTLTKAELGSRLQACESENANLREEVENSRHSLSAWGDNAAEANAEAEVFRRQYENLKLRMEALGLATIGEGGDPLEQRLLKSVRDLDLVRRQKDALGDQLLALAESVLRYLKTTLGEGNPQTRLHVESELRATNEILGQPVKIAAEASAIPATLHSGLVLGCKEDLSLLVANFGSGQGLKVGMPLTVARGDAFVARARVVQVRERIAGAIIEEISPRTGKIKVGDQLRVEAF